MSRSTITDTMGRLMRREQVAASGVVPILTRPPGRAPAAAPKDFSGTLQADALAGSDKLYRDSRILEAGCWSHARRKFWDLHLPWHQQLGCHNTRDGPRKFARSDRRHREHPRRRRTSRDMCTFDKVTCSETTRRSRVGHE
ncbi:MAG: transposase [Hyphomicrobium sp.]|nr:transposase [Hyphomicrobium sp.]